MLTGAGLNPNHDRGLWAEGPDGALELIARTGDLVPLPGGGLAPLTSIQFNPEFGVGENGHIAFLGGLSDGRFGVFVSSAVAVPEPKSLLQAQAAIVLVGLISFARRRDLRVLV